MLSTNGQADPLGMNDDDRQPAFLKRLEQQARAEHPELVRDMETDEVDNTAEQVNDEGDESSALTSDHEESDASDQEPDEEEDQSKQAAAGGDKNNEEDSEDEDDDDDSQADSVALDDDQKDADGQPKPDAASAAAAGGADEGANGSAGEGQDKEGSAKPAGEGDKGEKKKRKRKAASPEAPKPTPHQPTLRYEITFPAGYAFGGNDVNIREALSSQLVAKPEPQADDEEAASGDEDQTNAAAAAAKQANEAISSSTSAVLGKTLNMPSKPAKKRKRRRVLDRDEGYDKDDPFVDDSELHMDMVKTCGIPAKEGFFVHRGELPLLTSGKRRSKKPKIDSSNGTTAPPAPNSGASGAHAQPKKRIQPTTVGSSADGPSEKPKGDVSAVVDLTQDADDSPPKNGVPGATSATASPAPPGPRPDGQPKPLDPKILALLDEFKPLVAKESFVPKNKFPEDLKQPLFDMAMEAVHTRDYEENFFPVLTTILPYNRFTLTKLVKRNILPRRLEEMSKIQEGLLQDMQSLIEEQMPALEAQYRADVNEWEKQHDIWKASNPEAAASSSAGPSLPAEAHEEGAGGNGSTLQPGEPSPPTRKFKMDEVMRQKLFEVLTLESEMVRLQAEKIELEKGTEKAPTDQTARKKIYARIASFWPEGWMTTTLLSREWSAVKKKLNL